MCRYWLSCVCLLLASQLPLQGAVARVAAPLPLLTPGVVQQDYSQQISLAVSGAVPFTYLLGGDDKPEGLLLDPQSGILHGSPTAAAVGTHRLKVVVTDYNGNQTSKDFLLRVTKPATPAAAMASKPPTAVVQPPALPIAGAAPSLVEAEPLMPPPPPPPPPTPADLDANWGRVRAYFVGGILISNDSSSFSSAHQFYALNVDKTWKQPDGYLPGISTYFETRLTSIPVITNPKGTTATAMTRLAHADTGTTDTNDNNFLTSQQTANVGVGVYLPFLLTRWDYDMKPNALFIAPIAKVGFNTLTAATSQSVVLPSNGEGTGTATFEQIYNHYGYGFRVGHMELPKDPNNAPEINSYLDIGFGRFSNLEDLICHRPDQGGAPSPTGSGCNAVYPNQNYIWDSRKRLYRIDIEGLLKIPKTYFYVGLNANIGQKQVMADKLDPAYTAPDDLRFLFGTKFDIAQLFIKLGVGK